MATSTRSSGDDGLRQQGQQSALASQRENAGWRQRFANAFPLGAKEGFDQWWAALPSAEAEHRVLSFIPHLQKPPTHTQTGSAPPSLNASAVDVSVGDGEEVERVTTNTINDPYGPRRWNSQMVQLNGKNRALNEFSVERVGEEVDQNLVMLHGYGAGLGFFYKNYEALSRSKGWKIYALDLLGMGRSSRPTFKIHAKDKDGKITEAENWFIDALEEWRIKRGLEKFTLLGHSLGGYLATAYALKYPGRLNKLILASPVGIPEDPFAVNDDLPDPEESSMVNEFTQDQDETTRSNGAIDNQRKNTSPNVQKDSREARRRMPKWVTYLWEANMLSPFSLVRWTGPLGPRLVSGWTSRRFSHLPSEEAQALHDYSYSLFRQPASSEYALGIILAPGAYARNPLIRRIEGVGRQYINPNSTLALDSDGAGKQSKCEKKRSKSPAPSTAAPQPDLSEEPYQRENGIPVVLMYGDHDWMDVNGGYDSEKKILEEKRRALENATDEEWRRDQGDAKVIIIKRAGHHVYLDGWEEFNRVMAKEMKDVEKRQKALQR